MKIKTSEERARHIALIIIAVTAIVVFLLNIPVAFGYIMDVFWGFGGMIVLFLIAGIGILVVLSVFFKWAFYLLTVAEALLCLELFAVGAETDPAIFVIALVLCALIIAPHVY